MLTLLAIVEIGFISAGEVLLGSGARAAARFARTGQVINNETRIESIRRIVTSFVCPKAVLAPPHDAFCLWDQGSARLSEDGAVSPLQIRTRVYADARNISLAEPYSDTNPLNGAYDPGETFTDINGNGQWDDDMARSGAGGAGDFVLYEFEMAQSLASPIFQVLTGEWMTIHRASISVQNEKF